MEMSEQINELAAALAKAQGQIKGAAKDSTNPHFKSSYADLASVWDACRAALSSNGIAVVQTPHTDEAGNCHVVTMMTHASGQWIRDAFSLPPTKADPQGYGSAITYMRRYALAAIVGVAPEDDDGNAASEGSGSGKPEPRQTKQASPAKSDEPPHVKEAKDILAKANTISDPEEFAAFFDGCLPRLEAIKAASENTHAHVEKCLGQIEAGLRVGA
jgi:hypothetical protein